MAGVTGTTSQNIGRYTFRFDWSESSVDIAANTSVVSVWVYLDVKRYRFQSSYCSYTLSIDGVNVQNQSHQYFDCGDNTSDPATYCLFSGLTTVKHDSDGSKSINIEATFSASGSYSPGDCYAAATGAALTTIPRASSACLENANITLGANITVQIAPKSDTFSHEVSLHFLEDCVELCTVEAGETSCAFSTSAEWLPNATTNGGIVQVQTKNGDEDIGAVTALSFTASVPNRYKPAFTNNASYELCEGSPSDSVLHSLYAEHTDPNDQTSPRRHIFVQNKSILRVGGLDATKIDESGLAGAGMDRYSIFVGGREMASADYEDANGAGQIDIGTLPQTGLVAVALRAYDTRGRYAELPIGSVYVQQHTPPTLRDLVVQRYSDAVCETQSDSGQYVKATYVVNVSTLRVYSDGEPSPSGADVNTISASVQRQSGSGTPEICTLAAGDNVRNGLRLSDAFNPGISYTLSFTVSDSLCCGETKATYLSSESFIAHVKPGGKSIGLLCSAADVNNGVILAGGEIRRKYITDNGQGVGSHTVSQDRSFLCAEVNALGEWLNLEGGNRGTDGNVNDWRQIPLKVSDAVAGDAFTVEDGLVRVHKTGVLRVSGSLYMDINWDDEPGYWGQHIVLGRAQDICAQCTIRRTSAIAGWFGHYVVLPVRMLCVNADDLIGIYACYKECKVATDTTISGINFELAG